MMDQSFAAWSAAALALAASAPRAVVAKHWVLLAEKTDGAVSFNEPQAQNLARVFTAYLANARASGFSACAPGRFLMPGDLQGSPALTFAPLLAPDRVKRGCLWHEMERRYNAYKTRVVKPFFRDHFARLDRQIVLVDALGAIHAAPRAVEDLRGAMTDILRCFRPGKKSWLAALTGKRIDRILFAATKADHLHHSQHPQVTAIMEALVAGAKRRAEFSGATTGALTIAALRTTVEDTLTHDGESLDCVRGVLDSTGKQAAFYPGALPSDPADLLEQGRAAGLKWLDADYQIMQFKPAHLTQKPGFGPPHIRLDRAAEFLIGDRLQ